MAEFIIAVPTYKRADTIGQKTLALLRRQLVPPQQVYIFVASQEEQQRYMEVIGEEWPHIVVGMQSLWRQRNFITNYFPEGSHLVSLDDDVEELYRLRGEAPDVSRLEPLHVGGLLDIIRDAWKKMHALGVYLWSLNVSDNPLFMKTGTITLRNGLCNGFFWGCRVRHDPRLLLRYGDGREDVERSVRHFDLDGAVLRFREFCAKTRCKANRGGLQATMSQLARRAAEDSAAKQLTEEFPLLLEAKPEAILGVKFCSGQAAILCRYSSLNASQFQSLIAHRQLEVLSCSRWVCVRTKLASAALLCTGFIERVSQNLGVLCLQVDDGQRLVADSNAFHSALREGSIVIVRVPAAAYSALGKSPPVDTPALPKWLEGGYKAGGRTVACPPLPSGLKTMGANPLVLGEVSESTSEFALYLNGLTQDDSSACKDESETEGLVCKTKSVVQPNRKILNKKRAAPKHSAHQGVSELAAERKPKAPKGAIRHEDVAWIDSQRDEAQRARAGPACESGTVDPLRDWVIETDFETALQGRQQARMMATQTAHGTEQMEIQASVDGPATVDVFFCASRIWGGGWGGQCTRARRLNGEYCEQHQRELESQGYLTHGRIDGPIPPKKHLEFEKWQKILLRKNAVPSNSGIKIGFGGAAHLTETPLKMEPEWRAMGRGPSESQRAYEYRTRRRPGNVHTKPNSKTVAPALDMSEAMTCPRGSRAAAKRRQAAEAARAWVSA